TGNFGLGTYDLITNGSPLSSSVLDADNSGMIDGMPANLAISGNDLVLNVVPEPGTFVLLAVAFSVLGVGSRRRKRSREAETKTCIDDASALLLFPTHSESNQALRRAA